MLILSTGLQRYEFKSAGVSGVIIGLCPHAITDNGYVVGTRRRVPCECKLEAKLDVGDIIRTCTQIHRNVHRTVLVLRVILSSCRC